MFRSVSKSEISIWTQILCYTHSFTLNVCHLLSRFISPFSKFRISTDDKVDTSVRHSPFKSSHLRNHWTSEQYVFLLDDRNWHDNEELTIMCQTASPKNITCDCAWKERCGASPGTVSSTQPWALRVAP